MMNTKMTNKSALSFVLTNCEVPADVKERLEAMLASLEKRSENAKGKERKLSPKQEQERKEREEFRSKVYETMRENLNFEYTCKGLADLFAVSSPKMANALTKLVEAGKVERLVSTTNKSKVWFKVVA